VGIARKSITSQVIYTVCLDARASASASAKAQVSPVTGSPDTVSVQRMFKGGRAQHPRRLCKARMTMAWL